MIVELAQKPYFVEMLHRYRLIPFFTKNRRLVCFITFFITDTPEKYLRDDMWSIEEDNVEGRICVIDQLWTDKHIDNSKLSYDIWYRFKKFIKSNFKNVEFIQWNRYKNGLLKTYKKEIGR